MKEFGKMKDDYKAINTILGDKNQLSLEQWNKVRTVILKRNEIFELNHESFGAATTGRFLIAPEKPMVEECRLFARTMMSRIMNNVFKQKTSFHSKKIQTMISSLDSSSNQEIRPLLITRETQVNQNILPKRKQKDAFTKMLDPVYSDRPPRTFEWTIKAVRSIFDEKTLRDSKDIAESRELVSMPLFAFDWSKRQYGLDYLVHQCAWDLINSAREHQFKALDIELFRKFIDEDYSTEQLTFFLTVRALGLRKGIACVVKTMEEEIEYTTIYLTSFQAADLVKTVFEKAGSDVIDGIQKKVRSNVERRPVLTLDEKLLYISLPKFLEICVTEFNEYQRNQLKKILSVSRILPVVNSDTFTTTVRSLISNLSPQEISDLYRLGNQVNTNKTSITIDEVKTIFQNVSLLNKESKIYEFGKFAQQADSPEYKLVCRRWQSMKISIDEAFIEVEGTDKNPSIKQALINLQTEMTNVNSALTCYDVCGAQRSILSCTIALQTLLWTIHEPDAATIDKINQSIRSVLSL